MTDENSSLRQARPYIAETPLATSLHFAGHEIQSQMWKHAPDALALEYTQTMMGFMLFNPQPEQISMIGLGGGSLAKFCHRHLPAAAIEVEAFEVPRAIFGEGCEGELLQVRRIVYSSQGYALGEPLWLQGDDEGFDPDFLFQFDEGLCHINLGDSGVMYVFGRSIVWQCH